MKEIYKHDIVCLERGDIEYLESVADHLSSDTTPSKNDLNNYAEALRGLVRAAVDLENL